MFIDIDSPFDLDHDGSLNIAEEAMKYDFMEEYAQSARGDSFGEEDVNPSIHDSEYSYTYYHGKPGKTDEEEKDLSDVPYDFGDGFVRLANDLSRAGLDRYQLEVMDEDERRKTLEENGLDADRYNDKFLKMAGDLYVEGLNPYDLELMDPEERYQALEDAGIDPDEFSDEFD